MKLLLTLATLAAVARTNSVAASPVTEREVTNNAAAPLCGVPAIEPIPPAERIVGGIEAKPNSWPWMCFLQVKEGVGKHGYWRPLCGCSVVNAITLLTAAHCVTSLDSAKLRAKGYVFGVRCGFHYLDGKNPHEQDADVANVTYHEKYDNKTFDFDVAILKLATSLTFNDYVSPVCLPEKGIKAGTKVIVAGWGTTAEFGPPSNELRQVTVPIVSQKQCSDDYAVALPHYNISARMLCAGYPEGGKDACQGDSGGPLVSKRDNVWEIQGITSWGLGCAEKGFPGVYTRVFELIDWIKQRL